MSDDEIPFDSKKQLIRESSDNNNNKNAIDEILNDKIFQKKLLDIINEYKLDKLQVKEDSKKYLKDMFASHEKISNTVFVKVFQFLIEMGFEKKVDVDNEELKKLTEIMQKYPVAFVSSHKSYLDLIIFFILLSKYDLPLPFIFSGANLRFPVFGDISKKSGIIFIKRTVKDDIVYKTVLKHFISWLVKKKSHFVWAIEGTRTRTGKTLIPKMGILKYLSDETGIKYVPVSIVYDLIPDLDEILIEGQGKSKKEETFEWLISYFRKICSENRGKISIRFGDFFEKKDDKIDIFATKLIKEINNITPITTVSLVCIVLLNKISINENNLFYYVSKLMNMVSNKELFVYRKNSIHKSVDKAVRLLIQEDIIRKQEDRYIINHYKYFQATYYSNMCVQHFYKRAFSEIASLSSSHTDFQNNIKLLKNFFEFEFLYTDDKIEKIEKIEKDDIFISPAILGNCLEVYKVVSEARKLKPKLEGKEFLTYCLFLSEEMYYLGKIKKIETSSSSFLQNAIRKIYNDKVDYQIDKINGKINHLTELNLKNTSNIIKSTYEIEDSNPLTEEILKGDRGPHIGAFFDLDKTIIKGFSSLSFVKNRLMSGKFTSHEVINQFFGVIQYLYDKQKFEEMVETSTLGLKNIKEKEFIDLGEEILKDISIYEEAVDLINAHISMDHTICIISAASQYQVIPIARKLNILRVECTRLEIENGKFTGRIIKPCCWGQGKAEAGRKLAKIYNLDLNKTYFYTDSEEDLPLLEIVGKPRPVNPSPELIEISYKRNWKIQNFEDDRESQIENIVRSGLSYSLLIPAVIKGFMEGGKYSVLNSIADVAVSAGGVILNIDGEENLWKTRPAVFIFNHQSHFDMIIATKLIKKDAVSVARKEIKQYPVIGQALEAAGTIFIDRENKEKAIDTLKPAVDGLKNGTSLIIFPEGTRSFGYTLGNFKKGGFHIAMQAGVPIVPIIIKNSHDIMPRGTFTIIPGIINIKVLPPISTSDWTLENMNEKISQVRSLYLKELGQ